MLSLIHIFVSHLKTRRSGVDWETVLDTQYTQIGIGYAVDADGVPYCCLLYTSLRPQHNSPLMRHLTHMALLC